MVSEETDRPQVAFVYECLDCRARITADRRPDRCPECDGRLRNASFQPAV